MPQRRFAYHRDGASSSPFAAMRQFMQSELKNVPLLETRLKTLMDIQQERIGLQRERWQIAENRQLTPEQSLKAFHALVKREDAISARITGIVKQLVADAPEINKQIGLRKSRLNERLTQLEANAGTFDDEQNQQERNNLSRALKVYDFLEKRVSGVSENPERTDLLNRFFKGFPGSDLHDSDSEQSDNIRKRIDELTQEQREIHRRVQKLDKELETLRDSIQTGGRKAFRRAINEPGEGRPGGAPGPREDDKPTTGMAGNAR